MISLLTAIIGNTFSAIVGNSLKSLMTSNVLQTKTFREVISSISKITVLLITISILITSVILLFCFGLIYFLIENGMTFYSSIAILMVIKLLIIAVAVMKLKCAIKQINISDSTSSESDQNGTNHKPGIVQSTVHSFIEGFNSRK